MSSDDWRSLNYKEPKDVMVTLHYEAGYIDNLSRGHFIISLNQ